MATAMEKRAAVVAKYGEGLTNTSDIKWADSLDTIWTDMILIA